MSKNLDLPVCNRRERAIRSFNEHYDNLTDSQIEKVYALSKFGYLLYFVRDLGDGKRLAVLQQGKQLASVDDCGEIDFNTSVVLRK